MTDTTLRGEVAQFEAAAEGFAAEPGCSKHIETMMRLALHAANLTIRRWASTWLQKTCSITVTIDAAEDHGNAAPPETAHIR